MAALRSIKIHYVFLTRKNNSVSSKTVRSFNRVTIHLLKKCMQVLFLFRIALFKFEDKHEKSKGKAPFKVL